MGNKTSWCGRALQIAPFFYCLCLSEKSFHKELKRLEIDKRDWPPFVGNWHSDATVHVFENRKYRTVSHIVCLANWKDKEDIAVYGLLVHEAVHMWQEACALLGEDRPGKEQEAYSIQNLAQELMWSFKEQTK